MSKTLLLDPPRIKLVNSSTKYPLNNSWAVARTCYSPKLITEGNYERSKNPDKEKKRDGLISEIYNAGHHTTIEHNIFQFGIEDISRYAIWSFLHSHPFYNSEQQSQRFAPIDTTSIVIPEISEKNQKLYLDTIDLQIGTFEKLKELILPKVAEEYFTRFPGREKERYVKDVEKKAQEIARYILPIALKSKLHHTINEITLLRLHRLSNHFDIPLEQRLITEGMMHSLKEEGVNLGTIVEDPIPLEETPEYQIMSQLKYDPSTTEEYTKEFDDSLEGKRAKLVGHYPNAEKELADMVRGVFQIPEKDMSDEEAIDSVLNPTRNRYFSEKMNVNVHPKLMKTLLGINYTFKVKLSHTADSQSQRHRTIPGVYPILWKNIGKEPDIITPKLIEEVPKALELFLEANNQTWENINTLLERGVSPEDTSYLFPNAKAIRKWESGSLYGWHHKQIKRLCYNAQEEIWRITQDEALEIQKANPLIGKYFGAPCDLRFKGKTSPTCSEGKRYCGVKVWRLEPEERDRTI